VRAPHREDHFDLPRYTQEKLETMNGSSAFARTMRALDADDFRGSKFGLLLIAAVLAGWVWWMLAAAVPQYEISENALLNVDIGSVVPRAIADFPVQVARRIHPGQSAMLQAAGAQQHIPAEVASVTSEGPFVRVTFKLGTPFANDRSQTMRATASITVDRISPATIALRALGRGYP
jgi:hypothetical protein